jgi:hypothetical protein
MTYNRSNMILMDLLLVAAALLIADTGSVNGQQNNTNFTPSFTFGGGGGQGGGDMQCTKVGDTNTAFLQLRGGSGESGSTYNVSYTFDWGPTSYTTLTELPSGVRTTVNSTHVYQTTGEYNMSFSVEFYDQDERKWGYGRTSLLKIDDDSCVVFGRIFTPTPSATLEPTSAPTYYVSSSSGLLYSFFPALTMSGILTMVLS